MADPTSLSPELIRLLMLGQLNQQPSSSSGPFKKTPKTRPSIASSSIRIKRTLLKAAKGEITKGRELPKSEAIGLADGRTLQATILYNDLRGFSKLVSGTPKKQILLILDAFVSEMTRIASEFNGEVVDCAGDRIMAVFWRPYNDRNPQPIHDAVCCAFWMQTVVGRALNPTLIQRGLPTVSCGIGIDYGRVVVARVGIRNRNKFVFLGNSANNAAKLEGVAADGETVMSKVVYDHRPKFMNHTANWHFSAWPSWDAPIRYSSNTVFAQDYPHRGE